MKLLAECGLASEVAFHDGVARYEHQFNRRSHHPQGVYGVRRIG